MKLVYDTNLLDCMRAEATSTTYIANNRNEPSKFLQDVTAVYRLQPVTVTGQYALMSLACLCIETFWEFAEICNHYSHPQIVPQIVLCKTRQSEYYLMPYFEFTAKTPSAVIDMIDHFANPSHDRRNFPDFSRALRGLREITKFNANAILHFNSAEMRVEPEIQNLLEHFDRAEAPSCDTQFIANPAGRLALGFDYSRFIISSEEGVLRCGPDWHNGVLRCMFKVCWEARREDVLDKLNKAVTKCVPNVARSNQCAIYLYLDIPWNARKSYAWGVISSPYDVGKQLGTIQRKTFDRNGLNWYDLYSKEFEGDKPLNLSKMLLFEFLKQLDCIRPLLKERNLDSFYRV